MSTLTRAPAMPALAALPVGVLATGVILSSDHLDQRGLTAALVRDDGVGGADPGRGTGLRGLVDRAGALDGSPALDSPPGAGTTLRVEIPV